MTNPIFWAGVLSLALIYGSIALVLNLESGWGGMWDLGTAGLLGAGGYSYVLLTLDNPDLGTRFLPGWPMWLAWIGASLFTGLVALAIAIPSLRLRREYFLITTLALAEIIRQLIVIQKDITRGHTGIANLDRPLDSLVDARTYNYIFLGITAFAAVIVYLITRRLGHSAYGRTLRGARDNEALALSLGKPVNQMRIKTFVLSGMLIGAIAPLYVFYLRAISPGVYASGITFHVWTALVLGGIGSAFGGLFGGLLLIVFTEGIGLVHIGAFPDAVKENFSIGLLLVLVLRFRPDGVFSERRTFRARTRTISESDTRTSDQLSTAGQK